VELLDILCHLLDAVASWINSDEDGKDLLLDADLFLLLCQEVNDLKNRSMFNGRSYHAH
jgi:hypothetical protein